MHACSGAPLRGRSSPRPPVTLSDGNAVRHTFPSGSSLGAGRAIVVFAGASAIPAGLTNAVAASTSSSAWFRSPDRSTATMY
jgi:hypothetical protein